MGELLWWSAERTLRNDVVTTCPTKYNPMIHPTDEARWRELESKAHLPEVQELIRQEIQDGTIRVRPKLGGGIRILPVGIPENKEPIEVEPPPTPALDEVSPSRTVGFRGRFARP